jgi:hypothetical protein
MRHSLLWRQEPEESLSDWKIILEIDDAESNENKENISALKINRIILQMKSKLVKNKKIKKNPAERLSMTKTTTMASPD